MCDLAMDNHVKTTNQLSISTLSHFPEVAATPTFVVDPLQIRRAFRPVQYFEGEVGLTMGRPTTVGIAVFVCLGSPFASYYSRYNVLHTIIIAACAHRSCM